MLRTLAVCLQKDTLQSTVSKVQMGRPGVWYISKIALHTAWLANKLLCCAQYALFPYVDGHARCSCKAVPEANRTIHLVPTLEAL